MAVAGTLEYLISVDNGKLKSGLKSAESSVQSSANNMSKWAVAKGKLIADFAKNAVKTVGGILKDVVTESATFDKSMSQVAATLGKTTDEVADLSLFARQMGASTAFSANEAAQGLNYMALAGYSAETSMKMLPQVLNLAAAGSFDLARASDMVTDAQSALGLSIEETEIMVDQMAKTSSKTNTSVEQLGDAMLTVGGTAKQMKGGTEELSVVLGILADNGIKGSEGGTALRNVILSLAAPTNDASKALESLGVDVFDASGNMRSMDAIMQDMGKSMENMTQQERTDIINKIFNKRDLKSVEALLGTTADRWSELYEAIGDSNGAAAKMAHTQLDNLAGDVTIFNSALSEAKLTLAEGLTPVLRTVVQYATDLLSRLTTAFKEEGLTGVFKVLDGELTKLTDNMKNSGNPILKALGNIIDGIKEGVKIVIGLFTDFDATVQGLKMSDNLALQILGGALETVKGVLDWIIDHQEVVVVAVTAIVAAFAVSKIAAFVAGLNPVTALLGLVAAAATWVATHWESIKATVLEIWETLKTKATEIWDGIKEFIINAVKAVKTWLSTIWDNIKTKAESIWNGLKSTAVTVWNALKDAVVDAVKAVKTWLSTIWDNVKSKAESIWNGLKSTAQTVWEAIKNFIHDPIKFVKTSISTIWDNIKSKAENVWNGLKSVAQTVWKAIKDFIHDPIKSVKTSLGLIWDNIKTKAETVWNAISSVITPIIEGITSVINGVASAVQSVIEWWNNLWGIKDKDVTFTTRHTTIEKTVIQTVREDNATRTEYEGGSNTTVYDDGSVAGGHIYAKGDWNIPYDQMALLHRGEMVLTASQARRYRGGEGNGIDLNALASTIVSAIREGMAGAEVHSHIDGKDLTDVINRNLGNEMMARRFA